MGKLERILGRTKAGDDRFALKFGGKHVRVFMPSYPAVHPQTIAALLGMVDGFYALGTRHGIHLTTEAGSSISVLRSDALRNMIEDDSAVGLLQIDSDMKWVGAVGFDKHGKPLHGFNALHRLMARDKDVISGLCVARQVPTYPVCGFFDGKGNTRTIHDIALAMPDQAEPFKVDWTGAAFLYISRRAALKLADYAGDHRHLFSPEPILWDNPVGNALMLEAIDQLRAGDMAQSVFEREASKLISGHGFYSEDISFCRRCKSAGVEVWVDPSFDVAHIGDYAYTSKDWIAQQMAVAAREAIAEPSA